MTKVFFVASPLLTGVVFSTTDGTVFVDITGRTGAVQEEGISPLHSKVYSRGHVITCLCDLFLSFQPYCDHTVT